MKNSCVSLEDVSIFYLNTDILLEQNKFTGMFKPEWGIEQEYIDNQKGAKLVYSFFQACCSSRSRAQ